MRSSPWISCETRVPHDGQNAADPGMGAPHALHEREAEKADPQAPQKRASAAFGAPQTAQGWPSGDPQELQNSCPAVFVAEHAGQIRASATAGGV